MQIGVLGAAFDPPTLGHADVIKQGLEVFERVWLVPAYCHAFGKTMSAHSQRVAMLAAMLGDMNWGDRVAVEDCEPLLQQGADQPVYTITLLQHLKQTYPQHQFTFIIGPDNLEQLDKFYQAGRLKSEFPPFVAKARVAVRSTMVREALAAGQPIDQSVTPGVAHYLCTEHE